MPYLMLVNTIAGPLIRAVPLPIWRDKPETARKAKQLIWLVHDWAYDIGCPHQSAISLVHATFAHCAAGFGCGLYLSRPSGAPTFMARR